MNFQLLVKSVKKKSLLLYTAYPSLASNLQFMKTAHFILYEVASVFVGSSKDLLRSKRNGKNTLNAHPHPLKKQSNGSWIFFSLLR